MNLFAVKNDALFQMLRLRAVACYFLLVSTAATAQGTPEQGFRLMAAGSAGNCVACHTWAAQPSIGSTFGPDLNKVGTLYSESELRQWVTDARVIKPTTLMPPFGTTQGTHAPILSQALLTFEDIGHVVAALQTLR